MPTTPLSSAAQKQTQPSRVMLFGGYGCGNIRATVDFEVERARAEFEHLRHTDMLRVLEELKAKFDSDTQKLATDCAILKVNALSLLSGLGDLVQGLEGCDQIIINTLLATEVLVPSTKQQIDEVIGVLQNIKTSLSLFGSGLGVGKNLINESADIGTDLAHEKGTTQTLADLATIVPTLTSGIAILQKTGALQNVNVHDLNNQLTHVITQAQVENAQLNPTITVGSNALMEAAKKPAADRLHSPALVM